MFTNQGITWGRVRLADQLSKITHTMPLLIIVHITTCGVNTCIRRAAHLLERKTSIIDTGLFQLQAVTGISNSSRSKLS